MTSRSETSGSNFEIDRRERAFEIVGAGERLFGHPDDAIAAVIRHDVARADRVDELRRQRDADDDELALATIQDRREPRARHKSMRIGEALADHNLVRAQRLWRPTDAHVELIERGFADFRQ